MKKPVVALFIEGTYPWYRGGVSEWVHQYIKAFPDYRFQIIQVATDEYRNADLAGALYQVPNQVTSFERVSPPRKVISSEEQTVSWYKQVYLAIEAACAECDFVHVANTGFAGLLGLKIAQEKSKPLLLTEHALYWKEVEMGAVALECGYKVPQKQDEKNKMVQLFKHIAEQIYADADDVVSVSKCNINHQKEMGANGVRYIPNGVDEEWLQHRKQRNAKPVIGWIGRCAEMKNPLKFFDVIEAFDKQSGCKPNFIMMSCDAGEEELKKQVTNRAEAYPQLELIWNQPAEKFLPKMNALCITSHNESQPLVLFEALSKKVLPMGWQAGDVTGEFGLILPTSKTPADLADAFLALWCQPQMWSREVNTRFAKVKASHTWQQIFKQYRTLFSSYSKEQAVYE